MKIEKEIRILNPDGLTIKNKRLLVAGKDDKETERIFKENWSD